MPSNNRPGKKDSGKSTASYYKLKTRAVNDLVTASEENSPKVSEEELRKYRGRKFHIPNWLKVNFIKFWFPAAVCFFFFWGLGNYLATLDILFIAGIALGIVTDLLTNNALRALAEVPGGNDRWMMFPQRRFSSFFLNILYAYVVLFLVYTIYAGINTLVLRIGGQNASILGVEPFLFGLFYLLCDTVLLEMKHLGGRILADAKRASK